VDAFANSLAGSIASELGKGSQSEFTSKIGGKEFTSKFNIGDVRGDLTLEELAEYGLYNPGAASKVPVNVASVAPPELEATSVRGDVLPGSISVDDAADFMFERLNSGQIGREKSLLSLASNDNRVDASSLAKALQDALHDDIDINLITNDMGLMEDEFGSHGVRVIPPEEVKELGFDPFLGGREETQVLNLETDFFDNLDPHDKPRRFGRVLSVRIDLENDEGVVIGEQLLFAPDRKAELQPFVDELSWLESELEIIKSFARDIEVDPRKQQDVIFAKGEIGFDIKGTKVSLKATFDTRKGFGGVVGAPNVEFDHKGTPKTTAGGAGVDSKGGTGISVGPMSFDNGEIAIQPGLGVDFKAGKVGIKGGVGIDIPELGRRAIDGALRTIERTTLLMRFQSEIQAVRFDIDSMERHISNFKPATNPLIINVIPPKPFNVLNPNEG